MQGDSSSSENKEELPRQTFYSSEIVHLDAKDHPEPVKTLVNRLLRVLPLDDLDTSDSEALFHSREYGHQGRLELQLHAEIEVWVDSQDKRVGIVYHDRYRFDEETARTILRVLYCEPTLEFFKLMEKLPDWKWREPSEKLLTKRTDEKVYCEHEIGEDQPQRLEIPNELYDRALAALCSVGLENVDWAMYGYYHQDYFAHYVAWGILDVKATGDGRLWYKDMRYDFESLEWFSVKDGKELREIIEAQKSMTFVDFYEKYLAGQGTAGADKPPGTTGG